MDLELSEDEAALRRQRAGRPDRAPARPPWCGPCSRGRRERRRRPVGAAGRARLAGPRHRRGARRPRASGFVEVGIVVEELGRVVAPSPFLATVTQFAPAAARGRARPAGLAPTCSAGGGGRGHRHAGPRRGRPVGRSTPSRPRPPPAATAGCSTARKDARARRRDGRRDRRRGRRRGDDGLGVFVVPGARRSTAAPRTVIDPTLPLADVTLDGVEVAGDRVLVEPGRPAGERAPSAGPSRRRRWRWRCRPSATCRADLRDDARSTPRTASSSAGRSARSRRSSTGWPTATSPSSGPASLAYFAALTIAEDDDRARPWPRRWPRRRPATASGCSSTTGSSCTAASASRGRTTCTSCSSGPRPATLLFGTAAAPPGPPGVELARGVEVAA